MSIAGYYKTLGQIEDRVTERMNALRQADCDVALHCDGMAFDGATAADVYRAGLDHLGVPMRETAGLGYATLRVILKNLPRSGAGGTVGSAAAMAFDASEGSSALSSILDGIPVPRNLSTRSDRLR
jgi:hypothetical protein